MSTELQHTLDETLRDRQLLDHPFYRRWEAGALTRDELTHYAEQYRYFEAMLPTFLAQLSAQLSPGVARDLVDANLADEITAPSHLELFDRFARCYDAKTPAISPAMQCLVDAYAEIQTRGSVPALAGLLAYESQGAAIADSKAAGLVEHYGVTVEALTFWTEHGSIEGDHAKWTFDALASLNPDLADVNDAALIVGDAWWAFLDERELQSA